MQKMCYSKREPELAYFPQYNQAIAHWMLQHLPLYRLVAYRQTLPEQNQHSVGSLAPKAALHCSQVYHKKRLE
ncbi:hypothetical protein D3C79_1071500 [compost metagenome]